MTTREIKFRAISLDGIWFKWNLLDPIDMGEIAIDPETVGRYTGFKDKNGVDIFEGDILVYRKITTENKFLDIKQHKFVTKKKKNPKEELQYHEVFMSDKGYWQARRILGDGAYHIQSIYSMTENHEVVGNIYQNIELLK